MMEGLDVETFINILRRCPLHTRLVLTTFINKSFRMLRYEPELFAHIGFADTNVTSLPRQLGVGAYHLRSICCPAAHFANILTAKSNVVTSLSFDGGSTPLTALKACFKAIGTKLTSLSLHGEGLPNAATVKELGRHCTSLTYLDLSCGGKSGFDADAFEGALLEVVKGMVSPSGLPSPLPSPPPACLAAAHCPRSSPRRCPHRCPRSSPRRCPRLAQRQPS